MPLGTGRTGLSGPSTPLSFATYSDLPASATSGTRARIANAWSPTGDTEMVFISGVWRPVPGQILAQEVAAAGAWLLNSSASELGLTVGVMTQVYQSAVLPDWMVLDGKETKIEAELGTSDPSSTATTYLAAGVSSAAFASAYAAQLGFYQANASVSRGTGSVANTVRREGSAFRGAAGDRVITGCIFDTQVGSHAASSDRFRVGMNPGALTNVIKLRSWKLWSA